MKDRTQMDLLCYHVLLAGEQTQELSDKFTQKHNQIDWDNIRKIHDRMYNDDIEILFDVVLDIATNEIPSFFKYFQTI